MFAPSNKSNITNIATKIKRKTMVVHFFSIKTISKHFLIFNSSVTDNNFINWPWQIILSFKKMKKWSQRKVKLVAKQLQIDPRDSQNQDIFLRPIFILIEISFRKSLHYAKNHTTMKVYPRCCLMQNVNA